MASVRDASECLPVCAVGMRAPITSVQAFELVIAHFQAILLQAVYELVDIDVSTFVEVKFFEHFRDRGTSFRSVPEEKEKPRPSSYSSNNLQVVVKMRHSHPDWFGGCCDS